ncbi:seminal metalloprotease 1 [Zeugodacus cucurbitae]|uniref:Metalloendopeptidase n=1 Tax=Zeugodacus cucurbitae TaxID=28588 RepID=A0A0A1XQW1_ZEUCU|nr:seminal metalloprotease 1 [Zeugodacus cucurbitae]
MRTFLSLALLSVIGTSQALPVPAPIEDPELTPGFFEGDIVLRSSQRNGLSNSSQYWPNGIVYYKFSDDFEDDRKIFIKGAMKTVEDVSCVRFVEAGDDQSYFVNITGNGEGCYSTVGFEEGISSSNIEDSEFNTGCYRPGKIIHELLHLLGFYHMQSTHNRDNYVRIVTENIIPEFEHNFNIYAENLVEDFGLEYDYGSIMHYSPLAFSANGKHTIEPLQEVPEGLMGQRDALSKTDIMKLNRMYNCGMD